MAARGMGMPGMGHGDRPRRSTDSGGSETTDGKTGKKRQPGLRDVWPQLRELVLPRRKILALGFLLMIVNRLSGLVLPYSPRILIDDVIGKKQMELLTPLVLGILGATLIQGATSFSLTQILSKAGQRLIAELRQKVQRH
ncbi:MAG TPA: ABC transporter transmembrane domain-containing protein, partial [Bryobacteraceae bacterium]|nr:ABC transporter transmembrane domain-containing protein [Bryobacteraceae bacterium]